MLPTDAPSGTDAESIFGVFYLVLPESLCNFMFLFHTDNVLTSKGSIMRTRQASSINGSRNGAV
jgi:hypothetical protein